MVKKLRPQSFEEYGAMFDTPSPVVEEPDFSQLIEFLKDHLTIRIQTDVEHDYYDGRDLVVRACVSFDGEEICSDQDSVSIR